MKHPIKTIAIIEAPKPAEPHRAHLGASAIGNPVSVAGPGTRITVNAVLTKGVAYFVSTGTGKLCPFADLASGDYISLAGIAESTTVLRILAVNLGIAI